MEFPEDADGAEDGFDFSDDSISSDEECASFFIETFNQYKFTFLTARSV